MAYGASEGALVALAKRKGYRLVYAELAGVNLFFVRHDLAAGFLPPMHRGMNIDLEGRRHPSGEGSFVTV